MHARELVAIVAVTSITSGGILAADTELVELGARTAHTDGFRVKFDIAKFPAAHEGRRVPPLTFVVEVPRLVGRTELGIVWLDIQAGEKRTVLETPVERRDRGKMVRCSVEAEERLARDCVLHFQYAPIGDPGRWVKDYIVRLKYHLAPTQ